MSKTAPRAPHSGPIKVPPALAPAGADADVQMYPKDVYKPGDKTRTVIDEDDHEDATKKGWKDHPSEVAEKGAEK